MTMDTRNEKPCSMLTASSRETPKKTDQENITMTTQELQDADYLGFTVRDLDYGFTFTLDEDGKPFIKFIHGIKTSDDDRELDN